MFLLILYLPNVSNKSFRETGSDQLYENHKGGLEIVSCYNVVSAHGVDMAKNREFLGNLFWFLSILLIICLPNV